VVIQIHYEPHAGLLVTLKYTFTLSAGCEMKDEKKDENVSIAMDKFDHGPSAWFRESFGSLGKYGKISKDQFIRASIDIGVGVNFSNNIRKSSLEEVDLFFLN
jgi:hypothetical protein